ncbi:hypothetical protein Nepgr_005265 [Nepenthes gracilis]|uniref:Uncharacterized protein n=1 Tax=Nepenthes gracilis TaxID=150966 RepID=A0AAD3S3B6_NEPGR|nr:hypothetical protein Nepgr_005265 [Nepenthes gracilis]
MLGTLPNVGMTFLQRYKDLPEWYVAQYAIICNKLSEWFFGMDGLSLPSWFDFVGVVYQDDAPCRDGLVPDIQDFPGMACRLICHNMQHIAGMALLDGWAISCWTGSDVRAVLSILPVLFPFLKKSGVAECICVGHRPIGITD